MDRRSFLAAAAGPAAAALLPLPLAVRAQERRFEPRPGRWQEYALTKRIDVARPRGATKIWVPLPSVDDAYQQTLDHQWKGNARSMRAVSDGTYGAAMLYAEFDTAEPAPWLEVTSRVRTQDRAVDWSRPVATAEDPATLRFWTRATELIPTDGIVRATAADITRGARADLDKTRRIYDWIVANTWREPKVRGCGVGDIKTMLENGDLSGKCADINALFVGLARASGIPARDVYGIRAAPSAFGYRALGLGSDNATRAQHCRAEVFLRDHGWVAMDPADVGKVMREETPQWIKSADDPVVSPVRPRLFGGWEGNWIAYNRAHDVALPGSEGERLGFFMYPQGETAEGRLDPLDADSFRYSISARRAEAA